MVAVNLLHKKNILDRKLQTAVSFVSLLLGGLIYVFYRTKTLVMFNWFEKMSFIEKINSIRVYTIPFKDRLPGWVLYSLPDGLWLYSFTSSMLLIWNFNITKKNVFWIFGLPSIAILSEIAQYFNLLQGIFDYIDLLCYVMAIVLALILQKVKLNINFKY